MKKILTLAIVLSVATASLFAISSGVITLPETTGSPESSFFVEAEASELAQGLLLKYGDNPSTAILVNDTITKSETESWDVFGNEATKNFYFFGTGRASSTKTVKVTAAASTFKNGNIDTQVQPVINGYANSGWEIIIPAANAVDVGSYTGTSFNVIWDGSSSPKLATTPAGTYTTEVTLTVTNP
ncbi:MAG: hypothetical protein EOL97_10200 [Spirochaetia bacterium]|nr:hypothetical protein [Spirochaetia bacterium]